MNNIKPSVLRNILVQRQQGENRLEAGIVRVDVVSPAGSYSRRAARLVGLENITRNRTEAKQYFETLSQSYHPVHRICLTDAIVTGQGTVICRDGTLVYESAAEFLAHDRAPDGLQKAEQGKFELASQPTHHVGTPSLLLKRPWWRNFGHWLVDGAALLAMISTIRMPSEWQVVIGAHESADMRKIVIEMTQSLLPGVSVVEHTDGESWRFSSLHYVTPVHIPPLFKLPEALNSLRALLVRDQIKTGASRALYIRRPPNAARQLSDEEAIIEVCLSRGLEVVFPERYSIPEQIRIFHQADVVVGVKGAALTNIVFSPKSSSVIVLSPPDFPDPFFWDIAGQYCIDYTEIFGNLVSNTSPQGHNPFTLDTNQFRAVLDAVLARQTNRLQ